MLLEEVDEMEPGRAVLNAPFRVERISRLTSSLPGTESRVGRAILLSILGAHDLVGITFRVTVNVLTRWGISTGTLLY